VTEGLHEWVEWRVEIDGGAQVIFSCGTALNFLGYLEPEESGGLEPIGLTEVGGGWVACSASFLALQAALASAAHLFCTVSPMVKQWCEITHYARQTRGIPVKNFVVI
jgi:hypothetical protein